MSESRRRFLSWIGAEKGAIFWVPAVLLAAAALLFGLRQAVSDRALFNHARELRISLVPGDDGLAGAELDALQALESGLTRGLRRQRELTLVDSERVRARLRAFSGDDAPVDLRQWLRSTRSLNVLYCLTARLEVDSRSTRATLEVWEVASEQRVHRLTVSGEDVENLGRSLADSLAVALFSPPTAARAAR